MKLLTSTAILIIALAQIAGGVPALAMSNTTITSQLTAGESLLVTNNTTDVKPAPTTNERILVPNNTTVVKPPAPIGQRDVAANNTTTVRPVTGNATGIKPVTPINEGVIRGTVRAVSADAIRIGDTNVGVVAETKYHVPGIKDAKLADIKVGMNVIAETKRLNDRAYAISINVVPIVQHFVGEVTAFSYDAARGGRIAIKDREGKTYSFEIVAGEFTVQPKDAKIKTGDQVTVLTQRIKNEDEPVAVGAIVSIPQEHYSGKITAFSYDREKGGSISLQGSDGRNLTFDIIAGKFSVQPEGATVKVGEEATVIVQTLPGASKPVAISVYITIPARHFEGKVTEFSYDPARGGSISIVDKDGKKLTFDIEAGKFTVQPKDAVVKIGDIVTVVAQDREGKSPVALGVVIQPRPISVKGIITKIDETAKTITVGTTVISYNNKTTFVLHGVLAVSQGLQATANCYEQADHTILAQNVSVEVTPVASPR